MTLPVLLGANIDPTWADAQQPVRLARRMDAAGLDLLTVQDHPYQSAFYDTWTLIGYLAAATERVTLVPTVANLPLRPPAILAKSASSLHRLSGGRLQLGLGAGALWDAIAAMGGPRRTPGQAVDALDEAIDVIRAVWSDERSVRFEGAYYRVKGLHPGPPAGPDLGIWLGAYGPRTLRMTGARADGWMPSLGFLPLDRLKDAVARVDDAAREAGRDPARLRKVYNLNGLIGTADSGTPFRGTVRQWIEQITGLVRDFGMNAFVYWPDDDHERQLALFAGEVAPAVREALAAR
ncbi:LLM class flavin-dependent oxidoreductase [Streptomyces luteireticuli]|uniref:LLM class flavin-dependent oxidoreductase n=1 Tax=Streptomyces luteireticuli TaxID=173858 RepID=UPI003557B398